MTDIYKAKISMYEKGSLKAVGDRSGAGYNVKLYWGEELLASSPNLMQCLEHAFVGIRLCNPKYRHWLTPALRIELLTCLDEAILLTDGKLRNKEGMEKNMYLGITWYFDPAKKIEIRIRMKEMKYFWSYGEDRLECTITNKGDVCSFSVSPAIENIGDLMSFNLDSYIENIIDTIVIQAKSITLKTPQVVLN